MPCLTVRDHWSLARIENDKEKMATDGGQTQYSEKLQKVLADLGYGSRRKLEAKIAEGHISVNGSVANLGQRVAELDVITFEGNEIEVHLQSQDLPKLLLMNKLAGWEVSRNPSHDRTSVFSRLPPLSSGRWVSVGRLDIASSGLLLFTDNGDLAHRLLHPSYGFDREYAVRIRGELSDDSVENLKEGVRIDGELLRFSDIQYYNGRGSNHWYHVVVREGRNREVRRLFESEGVVVSRLKRVRFGPIFLPSWVRRGKTIQVNENDTAEMCERVGLHGSVPGNRKSSHARRKPSRSVLLGKRDQAISNR